MNTIIFSRNRAMQLNLLLQGLTLPTTILYTYDPEFEAGYKKLIKMYSEFDFVKEINFKEQLIKLLNSEYILFLVDDDFVVEPFDINCKEFEQFKNNRLILCLSLRLAINFKEVPSFFPGNIWRWKNHHHSWGYPMSVTSTIFRRKDILPIIKNSNFNNPNELEIILRQHPPERPYMSCCDTAKFCNNLANQIQTKYKFKNLHISPLELEEKFLSGKRISLQKMREKALEANYCFIMEPYSYE
jgi:hypothetical protein